MRELLESWLLPIVLALLALVLAVFLVGGFMPWPGQGLLK